MEKLFIASNNKDKIFEIKEILKKNNYDIEVLCPKDFNDHDEPEENGTSFKENAYIKARYFYDKYNMPTLSDDSGICINFYNGGPGIYSSRFLSHLDYFEKNEEILKQMKDAKDRGAHYECDLCFINNNEVKYYVGLNYGEIALQQKGSEGFGYDPIFLIKEFNKTEAELGNEYKNEHSHRAIALKKWVEDFEKQ